MEILFEILLWVLQFFGELILQLVFEFIASMGLHGVREPFRLPKIRHPWLVAVCYVVLGAIAGWLSLIFFPSSLLHSHFARIANLVLTPLAAGGMMALIGAWRQRRDLTTINLDQFACGYVFALAMGIIRFVYAAT